MRPLAQVLALALLLPWGLAEPLRATFGEPLVLAFSGLPDGPLTLSLPQGFAALLTPNEAQAGLAVAVVVVGREAPPGIFALCLEGEGGRVCREVEVPALTSLHLEAPPRVFGQNLPLLLENKGNLPLEVDLYPLDSPVGFPRKRLPLPPGQREALTLPLAGYGPLRLGVRFGGREEVHLIQILPLGGAPPPYRLEGLLEGAFGSAEGLAGRLALSGQLANEVAVEALLSFPTPITGRLALWTGPFRLGLSGSGVLVGYREGPWTLEGLFGPSPHLAVAHGDGLRAYTLRLSQGPRLALSFLDGGERLNLSLGQGGFGVGYTHLGAPFLDLQYERGTFRASLGEGPVMLEGGFPPFRLRLAYTALWEGMTLTGEASLGAARFLGASSSLSLPPWTFALRGRVGDGSHLALGLGYREGPWGVYVEGGYDGRFQGRLSLTWEDPSEPFRLALAASYPWSFRLSGTYRFGLPVPEQVTLALGGFEKIPVEARVLLLGEGLPQARVQGEEAEVRTNENGGFRLFVRPSGERVRLLPPEGLLALPKEVLLKPQEAILEIHLLPAGRLSLRCGEGGEGAYLLGVERLFLPCGGRAVLPPGTYRLLPREKEGYVGEEKTLELKPLETLEAELLFSPHYLPQGESLLTVELPNGAARGEVVEVLVRGEGAATVELEGPSIRLSLPLEDGVARFRFQVPWEVEGELFPLRVRVPGTERTYPLPLVEKPLLSLRLEPGRARVGERVEVRLLALFPAEAAWLLLGETLLLERSQEGFEGSFVLAEKHLSLATPLRRFLSLPLIARACQGERCVEVGARVLVEP